jgi:dihydroorotate dehydrogenase (fumarate)
MIDLATSYLGLQLTGPVIASAGPLTGRLDDLLQLEAAGASAAVLPSLFEEEVLAEELSLRQALAKGVPASVDRLSPFPYTDFYTLGPERHVRLVEEAKRRLSIPVIASVNAAHSGSWERYAGMMADAGADAVELNIYAMATDPTKSAADVEADYLEIIGRARAVVDVPLTVKLSPYFSSLPHLAAAVVQAGADGLVLFNRYYQPRLDLRTLTVKPTMQMSMPNDLRLPLRWLTILRPQLPGTSMAVSSGVDSVKDLVTALLVGADVACMTSAVLRHGPEHVRVVLDGLTACLEENEYASVAELRSAGTAAAGAAGADDPASRDRADYVEALSRFRPLTRL